MLIEVSINNCCVAVYTEDCCAIYICLPFNEVFCDEFVSFVGLQHLISYSNIKKLGISKIDGEQNFRIYLIQTRAHEGHITFMREKE